MRTLLFFFAGLTACASGPIDVPLSQQDPSQIYEDLFVQVQTAPVYPDSKQFVDMAPRQAPEKILSAYKKKKNRSRDELKTFVEQQFDPPVSADTAFQHRSGDSIDQHIQRLWPALKRNADAEVAAADSLIRLPYSYIVPGGRFREIYYWDSYFTQLGLIVDDQDEIFKDMVRNFNYLIMTLGRVPNGNRDYYRSRSQPPFFSHMVELWTRRYGTEPARQFLPALIREHEFWTSGDRVVSLSSKESLSRYWDEQSTPRPEAYKEDVALTKKAEVYRELRAAAESGWDFSTRWFADPKQFASIQTTDLIPIDLNALLYHLEMTISKLAEATEHKDTASQFRYLAEHRRYLVHKYLWDEKSGTFRDYNWKTKTLSNEETVAMVVPLFVGLASYDQAVKVAEQLQNKFLKPGGLVTTLRTSDQQWDSPNGWPPHQWMGYAGLKRYKQNKLAEEIRERWMQLNRKVYQDTGKMMEKYNVIDLGLKSGGGEYPLQDGFGWTNGVYRALHSPIKVLQNSTE